MFNQEKQCFRSRISNISQLIIFGNIHLPQEVIELVISHQIPVLYLSSNGEFLGRLENTSQQQAKYLTYQRRRTRDNEFNRVTAESILRVKLHNQHGLLQKWNQYHTNYTTKRALNYLTLLMDNLPISTSMAELRECSQEADNIYHCAITSLFSFYCSRYPHPTAKQISKLLNLGNQLLHQYIYTTLNTIGLDPNYAILHQSDRHELPLILDFAAEFRPAIVDDLVLNFALNLPHPHLNSDRHGNGKKRQTILDRFLQQWEGQLGILVFHSHAGEVSYRQCINLQIREYLAYLLGDIESYHPVGLKFHSANLVKNQPLKRKKDLFLAGDRTTTQNPLRLVGS
jgi:CRISPR-associated protein Cas1